jgi:hypothetical protein
MCPLCSNKERKEGKKLVRKERKKELSGWNILKSLAKKNFLKKLLTAGFGFLLNQIFITDIVSYEKNWAEIEQGSSVPIRASLKPASQ